MSRIANAFNAVKNTKRSLATITSPASIVNGNIKEVESDEKAENWSHSIVKKVQESISIGEPHFRLGGTKSYFPKARVILLRPNAKHTPYQAKFIVPKSFNKLDLRDYLFHVYGLRALNVTTQLLHGKYIRDNNSRGRYRAPQIKKMTIDMEKPFIWPEAPEDLGRVSDMNAELTKMIDGRFAGKSDEFKKTGAFDGLYDDPEVLRNYIPKSTAKKLKENLEKATHGSNYENYRQQKIAEAPGKHKYDKSKQRGYEIMKKKKAKQLQRF